jgi:hypothetical protein
MPPLWYIRPQWTSRPSFGTTTIFGASDERPAGAIAAQRTDANSTRSATCHLVLRACRRRAAPPEACLITGITPQDAHRKGLGNRVRPAHPRRDDAVRHLLRRLQQHPL